MQKRILGELSTGVDAESFREYWQLLDKDSTFEVIEVTFPKCLNENRMNLN